MRKGWKETQATIARIYETPAAEGSTFSVAFTYQVGDSYFGGTFTAANRGQHYEGEKIPVWYDPIDPGRNNLVQREELMKWVCAVIALALVLYWIYSLVQPNIK